MPPSSAALKRCKSRAPKIEFPEPIQRDLGCPVVPRKIFRFAATPNHQHHPRCPTPQSGGWRTSRTRSGMRGRGGGASRATPLTAKSCGPDAATLASSFRGVTVKAIAHAGCWPPTCGDYSYAFYLCARGHGCVAHPAFPALCFPGGPCLRHSSGISRLRESETLS
jgi:hypothetical protein